MTVSGDEESAADTWSAASGGAGSDTELSRVEFRSRARALFRRHHSPTETQPLRDHERAFIERGELLSPSQRYQMVMRMQHYERQMQGETGGLATGVDLFTDEALQRLEAGMPEGNQSAAGS